MISKAKSCPGGTALFNYIVNEQKGYELFRNGLSGITPKELYSDMSIIQNQNLRCTNNTISIVLSPSIKDGSQMSNDQLKNLTENFLKELDLDPKQRQFIAFVHTEKDHKHVHILMNRVKTNGKLLQDSFISKNAQEAAHKAAMTYGLTSAKDLKEASERKRKNSNKEVKNIIKKANYLVLKSKPKNLKVYQAAMAKRGIQVLPTINRQGNIQGFRFIHDATGTNLKASEVDRNMKLNEVFTSESPDRDRGLDQEQLLQDHSLNTEKFTSLLSKLGNYVDETPDENSKKKRRRNSRNR
ncbi:relaxase/mobilization nuclease domain-containing protein [Zunongwangia sp. SCSIO 43204]|uniref:relaxase/mobilization nuclease domain-containing protein n=1 Tax=Zunongwangia sp. SCSIO 43204 TaxID=2779359 RepID=UPI001CA9202B|nr:relaxase/mobilization nuclease domain-containing protein [Zunongwangia sp. SCSIO 43204]UAB82862.1 relaxase/mobilization nuclease domain-containing protein [Zunongwangia sp. SCSIO 43204]